MDAPGSTSSVSGRFPCMSLAPGKGASYVTDDFCAAYKGRIVCFDCRRGRRLAMERAEATGLMTKIVPKKEGHMANGTCQCCGASAVLYRKGGIARCYSCHKTQAEPVDMPKDQRSSDHAEPAVQQEQLSGLTEALPTTEGQPVGPEHHIALEDSSEPSWGSFTPYQGLNARASQGFYAAMSRADLRLSVEVSLAMSIAKGDYLAAAYDPRSKSLAIRKSSQSDSHALKVSTFSGRAQAQIAATGIRKAFGIEVVASRLPVTMTSWGVIVHLDGSPRA